MTAYKLSRRQFLVGCSSAIAAMAGARLTQVAFASPAAPGADNNDILVVVFLRGGWDALNVVPPMAGADRGYYEAARGELQVPANGAGQRCPWMDSSGCTRLWRHSARPVHQRQPGAGACRRADQRYAQPFRRHAVYRAGHARGEDHPHRLDHPPSGERRPTCQRPS